MTNKEAQFTLASLKQYISGGGAVDRATNKAIDMAIEALSKPEIVRCKDCKYAEYIDDVKTLWCTECGQGRTVAPYDFCSYAERREVTT